MKFDFFAKLKDSVIQTFFPLNYTCDICGGETKGNNLCPSCKEKLKPITICCPRCGRANKTGEICFECKAKTPVYDRAVSAFSYEDLAIPLLNSFKTGKAYLKYFFAEEMALKIKQLGKIDMICYIPMTAKEEWNRDYNQAKLLAIEVGKILDIPVIEILKKTKQTKEQKQLNRKQRLKNLEGSFALHKRTICQDKTILIIDDIMTTGATLDTASQLVKSAKAKFVYVATIMSVPYDYMKQFDTNEQDTKKNRK